MTLLALAVGGRGAVDPNEPVLHADDEALLRGRAAFETLRVYDGRPFRLRAHLERLAASAERIGLAEVDLSEFEALAAAALGQAGEMEAVLRLLWTAGRSGGEPVALALVSSLPPQLEELRARGLRLISLLGSRADAPWLLGGVKSTSYAVNMATLRAAEAAGAEDAIWTSTDGYVLEAPTSTVAWVRGGRLVTPPAEQVGTLPGTTAAVALALSPVPVDVRLGTVDELREADEVMLLSSVRGVTPVVRLDGRELGTGPVTTAVRAAFERAVLEG
jgi:4-amino-4-deoxychorismate lyase